MLELRGFSSSYDFSLVEDLASPDIASLPRRFFPGAASGGRDGVSLMLNPSSPESWIGTYAFESRNALICTATCPNPNMLLVVSGGAAYETYPHDKNRWSVLPVYMVEQIVSVVQHNLILLVEATGVLALSSSGIAWSN